MLDVVDVVVDWDGLELGVPGGLMCTYCMLLGWMDCSYVGLLEWSYRHCSHASGRVPR